MNAPMVVIATAYLKVISSTTVVIPTVLLYPEFPTPAGLVLSVTFLIITLSPT